MSITLSQTENELRYWLANEDWYMSRFTRNWLERTPASEATEVLAEIAAQAEPEPKNAFFALMAGLAAIGFMPSAGNEIEQRKAGVRAALMLADLNDPRCLAPLLRVFDLSDLWKNKYQELIETALTRYLKAAHAEVPELCPHLGGIRTVADTLWKAGKPTRDLERPHASLLLAALPFLHRQDTGSETIALLRRVAETSVGARAPRRAEVQRIARELLGTDGK